MWSLSDKIISKQKIADALIQVKNGKKIEKIRKNKIKMKNKQNIFYHTLC